MGEYVTATEVLEKLKDLDEAKRKFAELLERCINDYVANLIKGLRRRMVQE